MLLGASGLEPPKTEVGGFTDGLNPILRNGYLHVSVSILGYYRQISVESIGNKLAKIS